MLSTRSHRAIKSAVCCVNGIFAFHNIIAVLYAIGIVVCWLHTDRYRSKDGIVVVDVQSAHIMHLYQLHFLAIADSNMIF
jgi:hypothetical protein